MSKIIVVTENAKPGAPGVRQTDTFEIERIQRATIRPIGPKDKPSYFKAIPSDRPWTHWNVQVTGVPANISGDEFDRFQGMIEILGNAGGVPTKAKFIGK